MAVKQKTCKACRQRFEPTRPMQVVCSPACAIALAERKREKQTRQDASAARKEARQAKEKAKTRGQWLKEAQAAFNAYIRARDAARPCISCGRKHHGQYHAGHYLSVGARPELRFEPMNVWKQCAPCNNHLSGNAVLYRKALVDLIGVEMVEWLEGPHEQKKYTIEQLQAIRREYTEKRKALESV